MGSQNKNSVIVTLKDGRTFDGDILETDEKADIAALKIDAVSRKA